MGRTEKYKPGTEPKLTGLDMERTDKQISVIKTNVCEIGWKGRRNIPGIEPNLTGLDGEIYQVLNLN